MASVSQKHQKTARDMDRLSSLPDSILGHILSFLPIKNAVATSILATRWKSMFLHLPEIKLDDFYLRKSRRKSGKPCAYSKSQASYINSVNRLLMLASEMRTFRLQCENLDERSVANLWIKSALTRRIKELEVKVDGGRIPMEILTNYSLSVVSLEGYAELEVPKWGRLPILKVMKLKHLNLVGYKGNRTLDFAYWLVEDMQLNAITITDVDAIHFSNSKLQKLSVHLMNRRPKSKLNIVLNAPNLYHLELDLGPLSWNLSNSHNSPPQLGNLKFLELQGDYDFGLLKLVLHNTPYLERLICNVCKRVENARHTERSSVMKQLREVELRNFGCPGFGGFDSGLKMVLYFLEHGVLLKKMAIVAYNNYYKEVFESADFRKLLLQASCSSGVQLLHRSSILPDSDSDDDLPLLIRRHPKSVKRLS